MGGRGDSTGWLQPDGGPESRPYGPPAREAAHNSCSSLPRVETGEGRGERGKTMSIFPRASPPYTRTALCASTTHTVCVSMCACMCVYTVDVLTHRCERAHAVAVLPPGQVIFVAHGAHAIGSGVAIETTASGTKHGHLALVRLLGHRYNTTEDKRGKKHVRRASVCVCV